METPGQTPKMDITATLEQLHEYFVNSISPEALAQIIRRYKEESIKIYLDIDNDKLEGYDKDWISQGNHFLTELAEILDPSITKDIG